MHSQMKSHKTFPRDNQFQFDHIVRNSTNLPFSPPPPSSSIETNFKNNCATSTKHSYSYPYPYPPSSSVNMAVTTFEERICALERFKAEFGHCDVPSGYKTDKSLRNWCFNARTSYRQIQEGSKPLIKLTPEQIHRMEMLGFKWRANSSARVFLDYYKDLVAFREKHGHCNVTVKDHDAKLAEWVERQRNAYHERMKASSLTSSSSPAQSKRRFKISFEKIEMLKKIDFDFGVDRAVKKEPPKKRRALANIENKRVVAKKGKKDNTVVAKKMRMSINTQKFELASDGKRPVKKEKVSLPSLPTVKEVARSKDILADADMMVDDHNGSKDNFTSSAMPESTQSLDTINMDMNIDAGANSEAVMMDTDMEMNMDMGMDVDDINDRSNDTSLTESESYRPMRPNLWSSNSHPPIPYQITIKTEIAVAAAAVNMKPFHESLNQLIAHREEHGDGEVNDPELRKWCENVKSTYNQIISLNHASSERHPFPADQIHQLEMLGFGLDRVNNLDTLTRETEKLNLGK